MDINRKIGEAIALAANGQYLQAYTMFLEIYGGENPPSPSASAKTATGFSFFGLCLALVQKKYKPAIDLCKRAIELQFYNGDHYANLTRVYTLAGNRKKALETVAAGLKLLPDHEGLLEARNELGIRSRPPVPFLDRSNPINVTLGQSRHAKKTSQTVKKKKK